MYTIRKNKISVKTIASFLNISYSGSDFSVSSVSSLNNISDNSVLFYTVPNDDSNQVIKNEHYDLQKLKQFRKNPIILETMNQTIPGIKKNINLVENIIK